MIAKTAVMATMVSPTRREPQNGTKTTSVSRTAAATQPAMINPYTTREASETIGIAEPTSPTAHIALSTRTALDQRTTSTRTTFSIA